MERTLDAGGEAPSPVKKERQEETSKTPVISSLDAPVSPPRRRSRPEQKSSIQVPPQNQPQNEQHDLAAIEAGQVQVTDHLGIFSSRLSQCIHPSQPSSSDTSAYPLPRLPIQAWTSLYQRNEHPRGRHFIIHQHDHPIAGPHYDLRLQFSETSSVSWSVMYGMPGNPNSRRVNRNATETRVHSYWNHLIETASPNTGSMIIWDTGEYEILPYLTKPAVPTTDSDDSTVSSKASSPGEERKSESEKLREAFQSRKIRCRLHGTRLPRNYTIILRMDRTTQQPTGPPARIPRKRRRRSQHSLSTPGRAKSQPSITQSTPSDSDSSASPSQPQTDRAPTENSELDTNADTDNTDYQIRLHNAYPGSSNTIGSVHQRRWFITLDRLNSGFIDKPDPGSGPGKKRWVRERDPKTGELLGFEPFYVRGPGFERSVVTGRLGKDVLQDEGVEGFVPRRGWRAVLE